MEKHKKEQLFDNIHCAISMINIFIILPAILIICKVYGYNVGAWLFYWILLLALVVVILLIIRRIAIPQYRYRGTSRSGIGWGVGGNQD
jgi:membrane protein YdbS with pleckstrin-like domain